jgi:dihydrolipoamide dehydrogenase
MAENQSFEVVVLGGGPGGYAAALYGAAAGLNIALIEEARVGGTCLHRGCIPAKELLQTAEVARTIKHSSDFGITSSEPAIDFSVVQNRKNTVINQLTKGLEGLLKGRKVTVYNDRGVVSSAQNKSVTLSDGTVVSATRGLIVATGSSPREFPGVAFDGEVILSSDHVLNLEYAPASAVIIGGGAIGCEFASYFAEMGSQITLLEVAPSLLAGCDKDAAAVVQKSFTKRGMTVLAGVNVDSISREGFKGLVSYTDASGAAQKVEADVVIVSVGRRPRSEKIGLEENGIMINDRGFVSVDEKMRTNVDGVYAIGDLVPTPQLAHVGFAEAMVAIQTILGEDATPIEYNKVPWGIYCHPEVSFCGMTEDQAREAGYDVVVKKEGFIGDGRAIIIGETDGFVKLIAEKDGPLLGVHIVGPWATELLGEGYLAVNWQAHITDIAHLVHPHPTLSEVFGEAAIALTGRPIHG